MSKVTSATKNVYMYTLEDIAEAAEVEMAALTQHRRHNRFDPENVLSLAFYFARHVGDKTRRKIIDCALGKEPKPAMWEKKKKSALRSAQVFILSFQDIRHISGMKLETVYQHKKRFHFDPNYLISFAYFFARYGLQNVRHDMLNCAFGTDPTPKMWLGKKRK